MKFHFRVRYVNRIKQKGGELKPKNLTLDILLTTFHPQVDTGTSSQTRLKVSFTDLTSDCSTIF